MITTDVGAYQEVAVRVRQAILDASVAALVGYQPELRYADVTYDAPTPGNVVWARLTMIQHGEKQRTLGARPRVTMSGMVDIQLFVPTNHKTPGEIGRKLAQILQTAYTRGPTASVNFTKAYTKDMPREAGYFYWRINATYDYETYQG